MTTAHSLPALCDLTAGRHAQLRGHLLAEIGREEGPRRSRLRLPKARALRIAVVCLVALVVLAAPAYAILRAVLPSSVPPLPAPIPTSGVTLHDTTNYDGEQWAVQTYPGPGGSLCVADGRVASPEVGCWQRSELFEQGPVWVDGPGALHSANTPSTAWDRMWVAGLAQPVVSRLQVVMTDCGFRPVPLDDDGVFLFTVPRSDLLTDVWPYKLTAFDVSGKRVWQQRLHTFRPN
jgi:hypothetical protein